LSKELQHSKQYASCFLACRSFWSRLLVLVSWDIKSNERADSRSREEKRREEKKRAKAKLEMDMCGGASQMTRLSTSIRACSTCIYGGILYEYPRRENMKSRSMTLI
jgi:hypothetical protein